MDAKGVPLWCRFSTGTCSLCRLKTGTTAPRPSRPAQGVPPNTRGQFQPIQSEQSIPEVISLQLMGISGPQVIVWMGPSDNHRQGPQNCYASAQAAPGNHNDREAGTDTWLGKPISLNAEPRA